ncbi:MAG: hypothetical protein Kow0092_36240 [Deferrisomatales bacterium]
MANVMAVHSVGASLTTFLRNAYPEPLRTEHPCEFRLISSGELAEPGDLGTAVTLYLYRITVDEHARQRPAARPSRDVNGPLNLALHYLVTVWSPSALTEHAIVSWVMSQFHQHPILDRSSLSPDAGWAPDDAVQLVPEELSTEDLMRVWDALAPDYRLSVSYVARVVRIDPEVSGAGRPVVATRYRYEDRAGGEEGGGG